MNNKLSIYLSSECKRKRLSTKALALRCNLSEDYIRKIKRDEVKSVTIDTLNSIAQGLDISLKTLLEEIGEIELLDNRFLNQEESNKMISSLLPFFELCNIDLTDLSHSETIELANYLILVTKMSSNKYRK